MIAVTLDIDWAPDFIINWIADRLIGHRVRATWFVTHESPAIARLRDHPDLFELGIHPNFLPGSTHGTSPTEVLRHCMSLVPDARSMRTHSLVQSSPLLAQVLAETPIEVDVSLFLPYHRGLMPFAHRIGGRNLLRVPFLWEDDAEMAREAPHWNLTPLVELDGTRVFNFHPVHAYLNGADLSPYMALKGTVSRLRDCVEADAAPHIREGPGARTAFLGLLDELGQLGGGLRIRDIQLEWAAAAAHEAAQRL